MVAAYGFLGWRLSFYAAIWLIDSWFIAVIAIFILIWHGKLVSRIVWIGPRSLVTIFMLSMVLNLAVAYSETFGLVITLVLTTLLARFELQLRGISRQFTLVILTFISGLALMLGWLAGQPPEQRNRLPSFVEPLQQLFETR